MNCSQKDVCILHLSDLHITEDAKDINGMSALPFVFDRLLKDIQKNTKNAVESYHRAVRKFTKSKSIFPTDDSIRKSIYLSIREISKKWTMPVHNWAMAYQQFLIYFEERFSI